MYCFKHNDTRRNTFAKAAVLSTAAALVTIQTETAQPEVFEQTSNGNTIAIGSQAAPKLPSNQEFKFSGLNPQASLKTEPLLDKDPVRASAIVDVSTFSADFTDALADGKMGPVPGLPSSPTLASASATARPMAKRIAVLALPRPRPMSKTFSGQQRDMYWLAADSGRRFATVPAVRKSNLGQTTFVDLFTAMIQRESNFNPRAVSPVGAKGLGQLMPATASELGVKDPFSAKQNLDGAAKYLTDMLDQFGSSELALAAYNAGPAAVRKYGGMPPYRETRQYVSDVLHAVSVEPHNITKQISQSNAHPQKILAFAGEPVDAINDAGKRAFDSVLNTQAATKSDGPPSATPSRPAVKKPTANAGRGVKHSAHAKKRERQPKKAKASHISYSSAFVDPSERRLYFRH